MNVGAMNGTAGLSAFRVLVTPWRAALLIAAAAGLLVGMAPQIVNFFYGVGRQ